MASSKTCLRIIWRSSRGRSGKAVIVEETKDTYYSCNWDCSGEIRLIPLAIDAEWKLGFFIVVEVSKVEIWIYRWKKKLEPWHDARHLMCCFLVPWLGLLLWVGHHFFCQTNWTELYSYWMTTDLNGDSVDPFDDRVSWKRCFISHALWANRLWEEKKDYHVKFIPWSATKVE